MPFVVRRLLAVALVFSVLCPAALAASRPFVMEPPGEWVEPLAPTFEAATEDSTGIRYLLFDMQIRAGSHQEETYVHTAWRLETTAGLQDASEVRITFDPSFETLVVHHVRVARGGRTVWTAAPDDVRVTHAEEDLEARLYNDDRTATVFVEGLRVGDSVDYAYTLQGANPILGGHLDTVLWFEYSQAVDRVRRRILWQTEAPLRIRSHGRVPEPTVAHVPGGTLYEWDASGPRAPVREDRTPSWFVPDARVEVSDFDGWTDVARRCRELFASADVAAPTLEALVRERGLEGLAEGQRIERAVRFVQDEVRYLGLEMGPHSHQPHLPAETLERRFGDCKDKAALLVALLRRLGVRAAPALVSTWARQGLDERLPSMFAFDHVIVAIEMEGKRRFVDATVSEQGGPVRAREAPPYGRALVLDAKSQGLLTIPPASSPAPTTEVLEAYVLPGWDAPARLDVVTTYRGADADDMRYGLARSTRADVGRRYREFYANEHPGIRPLGSPSIEDDRENNVFVVREAYEIPDLWKGGAHEFRAWAVDERLVRPRVLDRAAPFALAHPDHVRQALTIRLPGPPDLAPLRESVKGPGFLVDASWSVEGNEARLEYVYRSLRDAIDPRDVVEFVDRVDRAADLVICRVGSRRGTERPTASVPLAPGPVAAPAAVPRHGSRGAGLAGLVALGGLALGFLAWGARAGTVGWRRSRRRARFTSRARVRAGERPDRAIRVAAWGEILRAGTGGACACGGPWREVARATLQYDSQPMAVVTRRCVRCANEKALYFLLC